MSSTAVDAAFEELVANSNAAEEHHGVCGVCCSWGVVPVGTIALCGFVFKTEERVRNCSGEHKCAECLAVCHRPRFPCGH